MHVSYVHTLNACENASTADVSRKAMADMLLRNNGNAVANHAWNQFEICVFILRATHPPRDWQGGCVEARCGEEARLAPKVDGKEDAAGINEGAEEQQSSDCCQHDPALIAWQALKQTGLDWVQLHRDV